MFFFAFFVFLKVGKTEARKSLKFNCWGSKLAVCFEGKTFRIGGRFVSYCSFWGGFVLREVVFSLWEKRRLLDFGCCCLWLRSTLLQLLQGPVKVTGKRAKRSPNPCSPKARLTRSSFHIAHPHELARAP